MSASGPSCEKYLLGPAPPRKKYLLGPRQPAPAKEKILTRAPPAGPAKRKYLLGPSQTAREKNTYLASGPAGCLAQIWKYIFLAGPALQGPISIFIWAGSAK